MSFLFKKVCIASDHAGYNLKENIKNHLINKYVSIFDLGPSKNISVDYPDSAKKLAKETVPSVVHVDNTCRVQTVSEKDNFHFYNLISEFNKLTGVPIILNTSFNENEPIVLNPDHAFNCFKRTSMDCLILENWVITR